MSFMGKTEVHTSTRTIGISKKILVDVIDYSPIRVSELYAQRHMRKAAIQAAISAGAAGDAHTVIHGAHVLKNATNGDGTVTKIRVRSTTFVFQGVE